MREIRAGFLSKIDATIYANPEFNLQQMKQIRIGLEQGIDASLYANPIFSEEHMKQARELLLQEKYSQQ